MEELTTNPESINNETTVEDNNSNSSDNDVAMGGAEVMSDYMKAILTIAYGAVIIVAVGGNVIVVGIVVTQKRMRTVTNYFLVSLACNDVIMASLCIPFTIVANYLVQYWPFGTFLCPLVMYFQTAAVFLSAFTMLSICIDRYRAVIFPLKPKLTTRLSLLVILITWVVSLTVSLPTAIYSQIVNRTDQNRQMQDYCDEVWPDPDKRYAYTVSVMVLQYFIPLAILAFTYTHIGVVIWVKRAPGEAENNRDRRMAASKKKMVKMMITVVVIYAVCWLPLHTVTIVGDIHPDIWKFQHIQVVWICTHWLAMSNSCYNPVVYCWMNSKFRSGFRHIFRFCPCVTDDPTMGMGVSGMGTTGVATASQTAVSNAYSRTSIVPNNGCRMSTASTSPTSAEIGADRSGGMRLSPYMCVRSEKRATPRAGVGAIENGGGTVMCGKDLIGGERNGNGCQRRNYINTEDGIRLYKFDVERNTTTEPLVKITVNDVY